MGLLAAGAAVGAAGAMASRRRNHAKWEEYESQGMGADAGDAKSMTDSAKSTMDKSADKVATTVDKATDKMSRWADSAKSAASSAADNAAEKSGDAAEYGKAKTDQFADKAAAASKNSRG
jgi:hypothetical protein